MWQVASRRGDERALGGQPRERAASVTRSASAAIRSSRGARLEREAALAGSGDEHVGGHGEPSAHARVGRARPPRARSRRSRLRASRRSRVSTLPWRSSTVKVLTQREQLRAAAQARGSHARALRAVHRANPAADRARRAGRRARGTPTIASPSGSSPGTSFAECTARSASPSSSACSSPLTKRALSPGSPPVSTSTSSTSTPLLDGAQQLGDEPGLGERERAAAGREPQRRHAALG